MPHQYSLLCPRPRKLEPGAGELELQREPKLELGGLEGAPAAQRLARVVAASRLAPVGPGSARIALGLSPGDEQSQAYTLDIDAEGAVIRASSQAGLPSPLIC